MNLHPTPSDAHRELIVGESVLRICRHATLIPAAPRAELEAVQRKAVADLQKLLGVKP